MTDYKEYRACLRRDFRHTCVYCLATESMVARGLPHGGFHVEHFKPKKKYPALERVYGNLLWSCPQCNNAKRDHWPTGKDHRAGRRWVDPSAEALGQHLEIQDSRVIAKTTTGEFLVKRLRLNSSLHVHRRDERMQALSLLGSLRTIAINTTPAVLPLIAGLERVLLDDAWDPDPHCLCVASVNPPMPPPRAPQRRVPKGMRSAEGRTVLRKLREFHRGSKRGGKKK